MEPAQEQESSFDIKLELSKFWEGASLATIIIPLLVDGRGVR
jgi:hypothetical protein